LLPGSWQGPGLTAKAGNIPAIDIEALI
jgi:hypothetical protein